MTAAHFVYIPCAVLVGVVIGWILGGRAVRDHFEIERRNQERKAERQRQADRGNQG